MSPRLRRSSRSRAPSCSRASQLQRVLADRGCLGITGSFRSPTTQGKNERSHQSVQRFLKAHTPKAVEDVAELLVEYREYYNHRRHHQSLPGR